MIRRILVIALISATVVAASLAPAPQPPQPTVPVATTAPGPVTAQALSTCAWVLADDAHETFVSIVTSLEVDVALTFPVAGEIRETYPESLTGPAASAIPVSRVLSLGVTPTVVEFSDGPAAAGVVVMGEGSLAADVCPPSSSKVWVLPGGSTVSERGLDLQLFNPFPEDALVTVEPVSEEGFEPVAELERIAVPGRAWRTIPLHELLPFRQSLSVTLRTEQGLVIPAMIQTVGSDQAIWTDVGRSEVWEFPVVSIGDVVPSLALANDGALDVAYVLDFFTDQGPLEATLEGTVPAKSQVRVPLTGTADGPFAVRLRAEGPLAAVAVGEAESRVAATTGAPLTSTRWLLPGAGADSAAGHAVWLLNTGVEQITATYQLLDANGLVEQARKLAVPGGTVKRLELDQVGISGVIVEAGGAFSVAWSAEAGTALAFSSGVPIGD